MISFKNKIILFILFLCALAGLYLALKYINQIPLPIPLIYAKSIIIFCAAVIMFFIALIVAKISVANRFKDAINQNNIDTELTAQINLKSEEIQQFANAGDFNSLFENLNILTNKLKKENSELENKLKNLSDKIFEFNENFELFKINTTRDFKNNDTNCVAIQSKVSDITNIIFDNERLAAALKTNLANVVDKIDVKQKLQDQMADIICEINFISNDLDSIFINVKKFSADFLAQQEQQMQRITTVISIIEKQAINILNAYIFAHPERQDLQDKSQTSDTETAENLQNIKTLNEALKNEVYQIKNNFLALFETNKAFNVEFQKNSDIFNNLQNLIKKVSACLSEFIEMDNDIKISLQKDRNAVDNILNKLVSEADNIKVINAKLNFIIKSVADTRNELNNLKFD